MLLRIKILSYILYLAIDEKQRGHGYGSSVLQILKKKISSYHYVMY